MSHAAILSRRQCLATCRGFAPDLDAVLLAPARIESVFNGPERDRLAVVAYLHLHCATRLLLDGALASVPAAKGRPISEGNECGIGFLVLEQVPTIV